MRCDDGDTRAAQRNRVTGFHDRALAGRDREVRLVAILDATILLPLWVHLAVIEEPLEVCDGVCRRRAADVVAVVVRREQVVDVLQPGSLHHLGDPLGIAFGRRTGAAAVDQHRLTGRRDNQRGAAALDVDHIDAQRGGGVRLGQAQPRGDQE